LEDTGTDEDNIKTDLNEIGCMDGVVHATGSESCKIVNSVFVLNFMS